MKKFILCLILINQIVAIDAQQIIKIETNNAALVYSVDKNQKVFQVYLGEKLNNYQEYSKISKTDHEIYMPYGTNNLFEPAVRTTHNDGNPSIDLKFVSQTVNKIDAAIAETVIILKDPQYPFEVALFFKAYFN